MHYSPACVCSCLGDGGVLHSDALEVNQYRIQKVMGRRSVGDILDQCYAEMFSDPPVNCLPLGCEEASTAPTNKHLYTSVAVCQKSFVF